MPKDLYTKVILSILTLCVAVCAVEQSATFRLTHVNAATTMRQTWEYKRIKIEYFHLEDTGIMSTKRARYEFKWWEDGNLQATDFDSSTMYSRLGSQGWELAAVYPQAEYPTANNPENAVNGTTSSVIFVFKRPKG